MTKSGEKLISAAKEERLRLDGLIAEQRAAEHAFRTGEIKRTPQNSTPSSRSEGTDNDRQADKVHTGDR